MSAVPPLIGLTTYREVARWGAWQAPAMLLPANYCEQVRQVGGIPVLLPPVADVAQTVPRLDGLILTGGGDMDPASYGTEPHPRTTRICRERDQAELAVLAAALAAGLPVLGICRGMQVLNVLLGGTLCQHLPEDGGHAPQPGTFGSHPVRVDPKSRLGAIIGGGERGRQLTVPTAHHQAIEELGDGLTATAWAADGTIEAVELGPGMAGQHPFVLAVQWHPEASGDPRLLAALAAAASRSRRHPRPAVTGPLTGLGDPGQARLPWPTL